MKNILISKRKILLVIFIKGAFMKCDNKGCDYEGKYKIKIGDTIYLLCDNCIRRLHGKMFKGKIYGTFR